MSEARRGGSLCQHADKCGFGTTPARQSVTAGPPLLTQEGCWCRHYLDNCGHRPPRRLQTKITIHSSP